MKRLVQNFTWLFGLLLLVQTAALMLARRAEAESQMIVLFASRPSNVNSNQIYRVRPTGQSLHLLTDDPILYPSFPTWSPDGQRLVFTTVGKGSLRIAMMDGHGHELIWLATTFGAEWNPTWSPDGAWLLFLGRQGDFSDLYKIRPNGRDLQRLTHDLLVESEPIWSPDGAWLAYVVTDNGDHSLWIMHPDGSESEMIHRQQFGPYALVWSSDSRWLYYSVRPNNLGVIYRYDMTTDHSELLHAGPPYFQNITPSPDGQSIAFISQNSDDFRFAIWRQNLATRDVELIAPPSDGYGGLTYSPDGHWLLYRGRTSAGASLYRMRPDGSAVQRITPTHLLVNGAAHWQPIIEVDWDSGGLLMIGAGLMGLASVRLLPKMRA